MFVNVKCTLPVPLDYASTKQGDSLPFLALCYVITVTDDSKLMTEVFFPREDLPNRHITGLFATCAKHMQCSCTLKCSGV